MYVLFRPKRTILGMDFAGEIASMLAGASALTLTGAALPLRRQLPK
jgi:hypothetical protein